MANGVDGGFEGKMGKGLRRPKLTPRVPPPTSAEPSRGTSPKRHGNEEASACGHSVERRGCGPASGDLRWPLVGFTPAEMRPAQALAKGERLQDIAGRSGLGKATVRS